MLTTVVLIVVMLLLSAFFSGMEIAFTSKNRLKLEIDRKQNRMFDQIAEVFARHPGQYITTILVGNNIALVVYSLSMSLLLRSIYASLGWEQLARSGSVAVDTAVSTVIIIFFAEFLPKSIFRNNPNFYYRALAPVIYFFYIVLYPVARFTTLLSHGILHLLGRRVEERNITPSFDREDLAALLDSNSPEQHSEPDNELKLFQNALDFADLRVRDCMVPRVDVEAVDIDDTSIEQLTARFVDSKYSRIFVWRKSIDNIVGYVNSKSLFTRPRQIADVMMEVNFVPETMPLQSMLENFIKHRSNIAVVIDEFGGIKWNPAQQTESAQNTSWGYGEAPRSLEEFYARLEGQVDAVLSLSNDIWGYCYTQLTDVEQEQNGIYYYDRTPKFDMKRIHAIFSKTPESK